MDGDPIAERTIPPVSFVAIDFETADMAHDSACALALVRVDNLEIVERKYCLIRPPRSYFHFTYLHGISWKHVADQPTFREVWPTLASILDGAAFLAAHNADFDRSVLRICCLAAGIRPPRVRFECTMRLARRLWRIYPTKLPNVCARLGIPLSHHDARSDAEACARIVIEARRGAGARSASPQR
jgi:DNA polymerase-3 subunit epsilon